MPGKFKTCSAGDLPLMYGDQINPVQHSKYHGYWCPGDARSQDISTHDIDYIE